MRPAINGHNLFFYAFYINIPLPLLARKFIGYGVAILWAKESKDDSI